MLLYRAIEEKQTGEISNYKLGALTNNIRNKKSEARNSFIYDDVDYKHFFIFAEEAFIDASVKSVNNKTEYMVAEYEVPNELAFKHMGFGSYNDMGKSIPVLECAIPFVELEKINCITGNVYQLTNPEDFYKIIIPYEIKNSFYQKYRNKEYNKILNLMGISYNPEPSNIQKFYTLKTREVSHKKLIEIFEDIIKGNKKAGFLRQLYNTKKFKNIDKSDQYIYSSYKEELKKPKIKQLHLKDIIKLIKKSGKMQQHINSTESIELNKIFKSEIHGISHNIRVSLLALAIAIQEDVSEEDISILLEAAKYHDIGRINDSEEHYHGARSSEKIDEIQMKMSEEDNYILKAIMIYHSMDDTTFESVIDKCNINDVNRCRKLCNIFKDADGLDRVRLYYDRALDTRYLRTDSAQKMVLMAYELFFNYKYL